MHRRSTRGKIWSLLSRVSPHVCEMNACILKQVIDDKSCLFSSSSSFFFPEILLHPAPILARDYPRFLTRQWRAKLPRKFSCPTIYTYNFGRGFFLLYCHFRIMGVLLKMFLCSLPTTNFMLWKLGNKHRFKTFLSVQLTVAQIFGLLATAFFRAWQKHLRAKN